MAFNVENLFDAKDDPGKSDETYLPANKKRPRPTSRSVNKLQYDAGGSSAYTGTGMK